MYCDVSQYPRVLLYIFILLVVSCKHEIETETFDYPFDEPCMIVNEEQDNTIEGQYIRVEERHIADSSIQIQFPDHFFISDKNFTNWVIGWGSDKPLYDAGVENIRCIRKIDRKNGRVFLGKIMRGEGFPEKKQRIVFWNRQPSGFSNELTQPVIRPEMWPKLKGESVNFSSVQYDSILKKWVMTLNGFSRTEQNIFAAISDNLVDWKPANGGMPVLTLSDFNKCPWAGYDLTGEFRQIPFCSDIVRFRNKWFLFFHGNDSDSKGRIGIAISDSTLLGPYKVMEEPVLSPGKPGSWDEHSVFYPKIEWYKDGFIMFYDGKKKNGYERVGMAVSADLVHWKKSDNNPVLDQHTGWRSAGNTSEPASVEVRGDTILLMVTGAKRFKMGFWQHYITRRMYRDVSGNVDDIQLGVFISTDAGKTFIAHRNNPVFVNDYTNIYENEHMGRNFRLIETDTLDYIFYSAKSSYHGMKYNIMMRTKEKKN